MVYREPQKHFFLLKFSPRNPIRWKWWGLVSCAPGLSTNSALGPRKGSEGRKISTQPRAFVYFSCGEIHVQSSLLNAASQWKDQTRVHRNIYPAFDFILSSGVLLLLVIMWVFSRPQLSLAFVFQNYGGLNGNMRSCCALAKIPRGSRPIGDAWKYEVIGHYALAKRPKGEQADRGCMGIRGCRSLCLSQETKGEQADRGCMEIRGYRSLCLSQETKGGAGR